MTLKHAPVFWLPKDEQYKPQDPEIFVQQSDMKEDSYRLKNAADRAGSSAPEKVPIYSDLFVRGQILSARFYPFFAHSASVSADMHIQVDYADIVLKQAVPLTPMGQHDGDWEAVELHIDMMTNSVVGVSFYDHSRPLGDTRPEAQRKSHYVPREKLEFVDGRMQLYIAKGSHTIYPSAGRHRLAGAGMDCDYDREFIGASLNDYTSRGVRWDAATNTKFPRSMANGAASAPSWLDFKGHWGEDVKGEPAVYQCSKKLKHRLVKQLSKRLTDQISFVPHIYRERLASHYISWFCRFPSRRFGAVTDSNSGPVSPLAEVHQTSFDKALVAQCSPNELAAPARLEFGDVVAQRQEAQRSFREAKSALDKRQAESVSAANTVRARKLARDTVIKTLTAAKAAVTQKHKELNAAHTEVSSVRKKLSQIMSQLRRQRSMSRSPAVQKAMRQLQVEHDRLKSLLGRAEAQVKHVVGLKVKAYEHMHAQQRELAKANGNVNAAEQSRKAAKMAQNAAQHHLELAGLAVARLDASYTASKQAEGRLRAATQANKKEYRAARDALGPKRTLAESQWVNATRDALVAKAKAATPADIARQKALAEEAAKRAAKHKAGFEEATKAQTAQADVLSVDQQNYAKYETMKTQAKKEIEAAQASRAAAEAAYQKAANTQPVRKQDVAEQRKAIKAAKKAEREATAKLAEATKSLSAIRYAMLDRKSKAQELNDAVNRARAKYTRSQNDVTRLNGELRDLAGDQIETRVAELTKTQRAAWKTQYAKEDKDLRDSYQAKLDGVLKAIRAAQDAELQRLNGVGQRLQGAKVKLFSSKVFLKDAKAAAQRASLDVKASKGKYEPVAAAAQRAATTKASAEKALKDTAAKAEAASANVKRIENEIARNKQKNLGLMRQLARTPNNSPNRKKLLQDVQGINAIQTKLQQQQRQGVSAREAAWAASSRSRQTATAATVASNEAQVKSTAYGRDLQDKQHILTQRETEAKKAEANVAAAEKEFEDAKKQYDAAMATAAK